MDLSNPDGSPRSGADIVAELLGISTQDAEAARDEVESRLNDSLLNDNS